MDIDPPPGFEDTAFLFACDNRNRGILRMNFDEAALLWKAARLTCGDILEIGRRHGGSTVLLALAAPDRRITSIDFAPAHDPAAQAFFDRSAVAARLELLTMDSRKPLPGRTFGLLFVDGDHSFAGVLSDVVAHWNAVKSAGRPLCVFHDAVANAGRQPTSEGARLVSAASANRADDFRLTNHFIGIEFTCECLVAEGFARRFGSAGSLLVLEKLADLDAEFAARTRDGFRHWRTAPPTGSSSSDP